MLSYAQNFEDVMLARALASVKHGFYVDVGAWDPILDSVTAHFSEKGWRGINIEPAPKYADALRVARPQDVNLEVAVGSTPGKTELYIFEGSGCSTSEKRMLEHPTL